jgi:hypothetical protein
MCTTCRRPAAQIQIDLRDGEAPAVMTSCAACSTVVWTVNGMTIDRAELLSTIAVPRRRSHLV